MQTRSIGKLAALLVVLLAACAAPPSALGGRTATVSLDGKDAGGSQAVQCSQTGWTWVIETPVPGNGFRAVVDTGDTVRARSVDFRDFGGFSGSYWADNIGQARVSSAGGKYTISGTAHGSFTAKPDDAVTTTFSIRANC